MLRLTTALALAGFVSVATAAPLGEPRPVGSSVGSSPVATLSGEAVSTAPAAGRSVGALGSVDALLGQLQTVGADTSNVASQLLDTALGLIGVPYRFGGSNPQTGLDCSGLVRYVYANTLGLVLPRRAADQAKVTTPIGRDELQPGDLVFFNTMRRAFSHVGVYLGDGKFLHAPSKGDSVKISDMNDRYWARRFNGARRVEAVGR